MLKDAQVAIFSDENTPTIDCKLDENIKWNGFECPLILNTPENIQKIADNYDLVVYEKTDKYIIVCDKDHMQFGVDQMWSVPITSYEGLTYLDFVNVGLCWEKV